MEAEEETKNFLVGVCDSIMGLMPDWVKPVLEVTNEFFGFALDVMDASAQRLQGAILCTIIALPVIANPRAMEVALAGGGTTRFSTGGTIMFAGLLAANGGGGSGGGNNENETFSERSSGGGKKPEKPEGSSKARTFERSPAELDELAADPAHGRKIDVKSVREREVGLGAEARGDIPGPIKRDPTGSAEFIDASGQKWDVKGFNSNFKPSKGGYTLEKSMDSINKSLEGNENVIVDTAKMSSEHVAELKNTINNAGLNEKVIFW